VKLDYRLKRCLNAVYFVGIMQSFGIRVKIMEALKEVDKGEDKALQTKRKCGLVNYLIRFDFQPLLPTTNIAVIWNFFMMGLILIVSIVTPFHMSFIDDSNSAFNMVENVFNIFFAVDMIFNFISAYYDPRIGLITSFKKIAVNYLKGWFWIDLIAV
jgi:hypothetical protein